MAGTHPIMEKESQAIEVEVVEIDGVAPVPAATQEESTGHSRQSWQDWQNWQGRVRKLDMRWLPLWIVLGAILLVLLLTVGLAIAIVFAIFRIIANILRGLLSIFK